MSTTALTADPATEVEVTIVDCDTHPVVLAAELADYIAEPYRTRHFMRHLHEVDQNASLYTPPDKTTRSDSIPPNGGIPGGDPDYFRQQLLVEAGADYAMLIVLQPKTKFYDPEFDSALFAAHNQWLADTWLSKYNSHGRYRGSIRVSAHDPDRAVREIEKWAGHPYVAQIYVVPEDPTPLGQPQFHPIYAAAARHDLPVAMHVTGRPGQFNLTPTGFAAHHMETYTQWPLYFMANLTSLVFEGVFEKYPQLRVVFVEGGFTWAAPYLWRLDRFWERLGSEVTGCRRRPSDYVREQLRFTTQPVEEPQEHAHLLRMIDWLGADLLMFSSDYPHYDFDNPSWVMPRLGRQRRDQVLAGNAVKLYGLPSKRPHDDIDDARARHLADPSKATLARARSGQAGYFAAQED
jgi:uncharacterized protein